MRSRSCTWWHRALWFPGQKWLRVAGAKPRLDQRRSRTSRVHQWLSTTLVLGLNKLGELWIQRQLTLPDVGTRWIEQGRLMRLVPLRVGRCGRFLMRHAPTVRRDSDTGVTGWTRWAAQRFGSRPWRDSLSCPCHVVG